MNAPVNVPAAIPTDEPKLKARPKVDLFLVSFLVLFLELACIRWFGSMVVFLTFFTNIILLATFLGMSVGCLAASNRRNFIEYVIPLLLVAAALAGVILFLHQRTGAVMFDVGSRGSPQQVYFGTEYKATDVSRFVVPIELVGGTFFLLVAMTFVGIGQVMGRLFDQVANRVAAYTINIAGSLAGIAVFAAASYLQTSPVVWFSISLALCLYFTRPLRALQVYGQIAILTVVVVMSYRGLTLWSPYYKIRYDAKEGLITTNNIGHQGMIDVIERGPGYMLPHLLNRDAGGEPFADVLIIGAGSGNDVEAALAGGARHIDAVEIDPAIHQVGRNDHPNRPYDDPRVEVHIDDGRSFVRRTTRKYDLVIYALVDSLVLHSGYSSLRLESFLFTLEAFADIREKLKPNGVFAAYNMYRQGWIVGRLKRMMRETFGSDPLVLSFPYVAHISPSDPQANRVTFILDGVRSAPLENIRKRLEREPFWLNHAPRWNQRINGFAGQSPPPTPGGLAWNRIGPAGVEEDPSGLVPSDDWPFLYLRERVIPALNMRGMMILAGLSAILLLALSPGPGALPNAPMFFLGAGFMLLESKSVVHMSLLFGSTWMVNSVVFFAILVMILCSNLYVRLVKPRRLWPYYSLLLASLAVNIAVPMSRFLSLPGAERTVASCAVVFVPIFFAGIIFATLFRDSAHPDIDFGSNIAGAILGGLSESLSLLVGFNYLLGLAIVFYVASAIPWKRNPAAAVP